MCWNARNTLSTSGSAHPVQFTNGTIDVTPATRQINEETLRGVRAVAPRLFARYGLDSATLMLMTTEALTELRNKQGEPDYVELEFITLIRRYFPTEQWLPAYSDACGDGVFTDSVKTGIRI
jgi:hypothetical protein